jgi:hypothetical protein
MSRDLRRVVLAFRWPYALVFALGACQVINGAPPVDVGRAPPSGETCEASCARRVASGCLEPSLAAACVPTCQRIRAAGLYSPERCRR